MMKRTILFLTILTLSALAISAQKSKEWSLREFYNTFLAPDYIYLNDVKYLINKSPLHVFNNYDSIYTQIPIVEINRLGPTGYQINQYAQKYYPIWTVKDNILYLSDIHFYIEKEWIKKLYPFNEAYKVMENLTRRRFKKRIRVSETTPQGPLGSMYADWVTESYYIKRARKCDNNGVELETEEEWRKEPVKKITFKNGKLMLIEDI